MWTPLAFRNWGIYWNRAVGKHYDVQSLEEELFDDPKKVDINPAFDSPIYRYIWTTNVAPHAVTDGVRGLFLPVLGDASWPGTVPMKYGKSWTPVICAMESTRTMGNAAPAGSSRHQFQPDVKGRYDSAPEIVGVREGAGSGGRMMVFPFHPTHTWLNFHHFAFNDAMMLNGDGIHFSDGFRLFVNGCKWLAKPATAAKFGGYQPPQEANRPKLGAIDWSSAAFAPNSWSSMGGWWNDATQTEVAMTDFITPKAKEFKGIVGVRTVASDGEGTVAEYVAEAKKLGLSFIIFLESVEKTDDVRFAKLVSDCKAQSNENFAAVPGYLYRDLSGNLHFSYRTEKLPLPGNLTTDRKVSTPNDIVVQNSWANGQGLAELGKLKLDLAFDFMYTAVAPYVYEGSKLVDDGLRTYCYSEGLGHMYAPVSLCIVRSPRDLAGTAEVAHLTVIHAEKLADLKKCLGRDIQHPHPVYISNGPTITRWGALNPLGHPFWPGKDRLRFALSAESSVGIQSVKLLDCVSGTVFREFNGAGAKSLTCEVDESHKQQWSLVPVVTDIHGRTAIGSGLQTYQDGNRLWLMGERIGGMHASFGWDDKHEKLKQMGGWLGEVTWMTPYNITGGYPANPRSNELGLQGFDGGAIHPAAIDMRPSVVTDLGVEPTVPAVRFRNSLASFDMAVMDYIGDAQFLVNKRTHQKSPTWWETPDPQVPNKIVDISERVWAVRPRHDAQVAANVHEITCTFKQDAKLDRINLGRLRSGKEAVNLLLMVRDSDGDSTWLIGAKESFSHQGALPAGGYLFPANYRGGAPGVINLGPEPLQYSSKGMPTELFFAGNGRAVKAGDQVKLRFMTFMRPWGDQVNNRWLNKFVADYAIGGGKPAYAYELSQGKLESINYAMDIAAEKGGATVEIKKYDLPHNLVVRVSGLAANAIAGRYDIEKHQLLILPVLEGVAPTSVNTTLGDTHLYVGELFHCDSPDVRLSAVQDGPDKLLVEVHNPTGEARNVTLTGSPGFLPLGKWKDAFEVSPFSSVRRELPVKPGSLDYTPYQGD